VLQCIGENAYKIDYGVSTTFNVCDLAPYEETEKTTDLRASPHQPRKPDMGIPNKDDLTKTHALAQLSLQAQQIVKAQIEKILMQSREF
jgi:hypothetical protein